MWHCPAASSSGARQIAIQSAYKQGFFWLTEQVLANLKSLDVAALHVRVREETPDASNGLRVQQYPARWLKALYPADEIFNRELGLPIDNFVVEQIRGQEEIYSVSRRVCELYGTVRSQCAQRPVLHPLCGVADDGDGRHCRGLNDVSCRLR